MLIPSDPLLDLSLLFPSFFLLFPEDSELADLVFAFSFKDMFRRTGWEVEPGAVPSCSSSRSIVNQKIIVQNNPAIPVWSTNQRNEILRGSMSFLKYEKQCWLPIKYLNEVHTLHGCYKYCYDISHFIHHVARIGAGLKLNDDWKGPLYRK